MAPMKCAWNCIFGLLIVALTLAGCESVPAEENAGTEDSAMVGVYGARPAAASAPGKDVSLALYANGEARLGNDYLNGKDRLVQYGRWRVSDSGAAVVQLHGELGANAREYDPHQDIEFRLQDEELEATDYDEEVYHGEDFRLERLKGEPTPLLADSGWELVEVLMMDGDRMVPEESQEYALNFDGDGEVYGRADCNRFSGAYREVDGKLRMGDLGTSRDTCPDDSLFELYMEALSTAESYGLEEDVLTIAFGPETGILVFESNGGAQ
ncbi:MAG: META domain-containing protein [Spirochaetia bacterium]